VDQILDDVRDGRTRVLVGTQMMAKGHDFPGVTLVGVINADQGLFGTDFRAGERLAQTLVQVAGRAGRADRPGEVLIQTSFPEHPFLQRLLSGGYEAFAEAALEERRAAGWPPFSHLALLRAEATRPGRGHALPGRSARRGVHGRPASRCSVPRRRRWSGAADAGAPNCCCSPSRGRRCTALGGLQATLPGLPRGARRTLLLRGRSAGPVLAAEHEPARGRYNGGPTLTQPGLPP
jgi:hypothetical protein